MRTASRLAVLVVSLALVLAAAPAASAQCFGPDGLDLGPCCAPAAAILPPFPDGTPSALAICWNDCSVLGTQDVRMLWSPPAPVGCGEFVSQLSVFDSATGVPLLSGLMSLSYTRTWEETDPSGVTRQVWRFVVKADIQGTTAGTSACVQPACVAPFATQPSAFYYGYMDYAGCTGLSFETALVLYHAADRFVHTPGLSSRPGVYHPTRSYALVAPHSPLQPFFPSDNVAVGGPLVSEAVRTFDPASASCRTEDKIAGGDLVTLGAGCLDLPAAAPDRDTVRKFSGTTGCGGAFASLDLLWPTLPWLHLVSTSLGRWTSNSLYPGQELAWVDQGLFIHQDACTGDFIEIKYGGSTSKGWDAVLASGLATYDFTDLADNYSAPLGGPYPSPVFGSVLPTDHLVYVNTP